MEIGLPDVVRNHAIIRIEDELRNERRGGEEFPPVCDEVEKEVARVVRGALSCVHAEKAGEVRVRVPPKKIAYCATYTT